MAQLGPILFHLLPLVPLYLGRYYLTIAAVLLVALPYIKVAKLRAHLAEVSDNPAKRDEARSVARALELWKGLTLPWLREKLSLGDD